MAKIHSEAVYRPVGQHVRARTARGVRIEKLPLETGVVHKMGEMLTGF